MSFTAGGDAGIALVSARSDMDALQVLKNGGRFNATPSTYVVNQYRNIGLSTCIRSEILMESYTNAEGIYDRLMATIDCLKGDKGDKGDAAGFGTVTASVDANVGIPSVEVSSSGPNTAKQFSFTFHNLKGEGGDPGAAAGFGQATATVDANIGVPSVEVSVSGPDTAKVFTFNFHNLKGEKGDTVNAQWGTITGNIQSQTDLIALISAIPGLEIVVVNSLPVATANTMSKIYLVPSADPQTENVKDEFITIDNGASSEERYTWEQIGSTAIDLSDYVTDSELAAALANYVLSSSITDVLRYSSQLLSDAHKTQARTNIGAGTYSKPSGGIPKTDLASGVRSSLDLADSAVQAEPIGSIIPPVDPSEFATKEEVDELDQKVDLAVGQRIQKIDTTSIPTGQTDWGYSPYAHLFAGVSYSIIGKGSLTSGSGQLVSIVDGNIELIKSAKSDFSMTYTPGVDMDVAYRVKNITAGTLTITFSGSGIEKEIEILEVRLEDVDEEISNIEVDVEKLRAETGLWSGLLDTSAIPAGQSGWEYSNRVHLYAGKNYIIQGTGSLTASYSQLVSIIDDTIELIRNAVTSNFTMNYTPASDMDVALRIDNLTEGNMSVSINSIGLTNEIENQGTEIEGIKARFSGNYTRSIALVNPVDEKYLSPDGAIVGDSNTTSWMMIPVIDGKTLKISNIRYDGNRSLWAMNDDESVKSVIASGGSSSVSTITINVDGYNYISICSRGTTPVIEYVEYDTDLSPVIKASVQNITPTPYKGWLDDYVIDANGHEKASSGFSCTAFIRAYEFQTIRLTQIRAVTNPNGGKYAVVCFDENKRRLSLIPATGNQQETFDFVVPANTYYIRYNIATAYKDVTTFSYLAPIDRFYHYLGLVDSWYNGTYKKTAAPFAQAKAAPIITFTDDDTVSVAAVTAYINACESLGIKGTLATLTNTHTISGMVDTLLSAEESGHSIIFHGYSQGNFYKLQGQDIDLCEEDIVKGIHDMSREGFANWRFWCTPFGVANEPIRNLAKKWGMECLMTSGEVGFNDDTWANNQFGRWTIRRMTLDPTDNSGIPIDTIKEQIDLAKENNGWVIVNTHFGSYLNEWGSADGLARLSELVTYATSKGFVFKTLPEAWVMRKPIYELYEMF